VTIALLRAFINRGLSVSSFKCGPDYIDPLFHKRVLQLPAFNLDPYFSDRDALRALLSEGCAFLSKDEEDEALAVIEGVMGYYDGVSFTPEGSTYTVAQHTGTPVILVVSCYGIANSVGAVLSGFKNYVKDSRIEGVIFNHLSPALYPQMAETARASGLLPLGFLPRSERFAVGSRHLGLVTAGELQHWDALITSLGKQAEETVDIDGILRLSRGAEPLATPPQLLSVLPGARIAVSRDEAFCFMYDETRTLLQSLGAEIVFFSPLEDQKLPDRIGGLWLCGGYPELYAERLAGNRLLLEDIKTKVRAGLPTVAECGGFMYLHELLVTSDGTEHVMAGVIAGKTFPTNSLRRFGYLTLTAKEDNLLCARGAQMRVHEFHYWDSTSCGCGFTAQKAGKDCSWDCVHATKSLYAGFPHLYLRAAPEAAQSFVRKALQYQKDERS
jgi:cobyrinic acid a,c-diamide synthase